MTCPPCKLKADEKPFWLAGSIHPLSVREPLVLIVHLKDLFVCPLACLHVGWRMFAYLPTQPRTMNLSLVHNSEEENIELAESLVDRMWHQCSFPRRQCYRHEYWEVGDCSDCCILSGMRVCFVATRPTRNRVRLSALTARILSSPGYPE